MKNKQLSSMFKVQSSRFSAVLESFRKEGYLPALRRSLFPYSLISALRRCLSSAIKLCCKHIFLRGSANPYTTNSSLFPLPSSRRSLFPYSLISALRRCSLPLITIYYLLFTICCLSSRQDAPLPNFIFDSKPTDAKAIGMGEAFCAVSDNASAPYWNTAGLKQLEDKKYFTICLNTSKLLFLGFADSKSAFSFKPISNYSSTYENKEIEVRANKYIFSSASPYNDKMKLGMNMSYISAHLGATDLLVPSANIADGNGFTMDIGLLYAISEITKLGLSIENAPGYIWWNDYKRTIIKAHLRTGISVNLTNWLLMSFDYENVGSTKKEFYHSGLQESITKNIFLRQGVISEKFFDNVGEKTTFGAGYELQDWLIDVAVKTHEVADYYISVSIPF